MNSSSKNKYRNLARCNPDPAVGLSLEQVAKRIEAGAANSAGSGLTPGVGKIILKNSLTLFNFVYAFIAIALAATGNASQILFIWVSVTNTLLGIVQELWAKRALDKLSVLAKASVSVMREGKIAKISQEEVVLDDIMLLSAGSQVCADAVVVKADLLEMDESLLTGESERIKKSEGDPVLSGSYVASGRAYARVVSVGEESYAHSLIAEAKKNKKKIPKLQSILKRIIMALTIVIFPLGTALFAVKYGRGEDFQSVILGTATSVLGMIPAGLIVLTGVTMSVGALKLSQKKALVQSLPNIETLARTDVLCLDKTGTITDGTLAFEYMEVYNNIPEENVKLTISELMGATGDSNSTAKALSDAFGRTENWPIMTRMPFSSERKWSGATFAGMGSYVIGSPGIMFKNQQADFLDKANEEAQKGMRAIALAYSQNEIIGGQLPDRLFCMALLFISDHIRENAAETFRYLAEEKITIKVISGDNPRTVSAVAEKAGLENAKRAVDMSALAKGADYAEIAEKFTVFGHVTPQQKRELIRAIKKNGHTACMTGDGVNDILAMRESDCSVAMVGGNDAARSACDFVLMSDDFGAMAEVLKEGRRIINNIEKISAIFLVKTIYSVILTLIYIFLPYPYPIIPLQMMPVNELTIGIPSFFLALQKNYARPAGQMLTKILEHTLPAAITVIINTMYIQIAGILFEIPVLESSTMVVFLVGIVGFYLMMQLADPFTWRIKLMIALLFSAFLLSFLLFDSIASFFFGGGDSVFAGLAGKNVFFYMPLVYFSYYVHSFLGKVCRKAMDAYMILKTAGWMKKGKKA
ncbi:MAG: HAD-IC family P-type ATPase [Oscillospiraceae bacterium]|nr:HAD-IC family P-type ATPase [Oscillospiraceae bacterium]